MKLSSTEYFDKIRRAAILDNENWQKQHARKYNKRRKIAQKNRKLNRKNKQRK